MMFVVYINIKSYVKNIPTKESQKTKEARLFEEDENKNRSKNDNQETKKGARSTLSLRLWFISLFMLKKENRLLKSADFARVLGRGRAVASGFFLLKYIKTNSPRARTGFVISAKVSKKAVERNLLKRRMREIIRRDADTAVGAGYDIVFVARKNALNLNFAELKKEILNLLSKINK